MRSGLYKSHFLEAFLIFYLANGYSQSMVTESDSLKNLIQRNKSDDTTKVNLINDLILNLVFSVGDLNEASKQLAISKSLVAKLGYTRGLARCYEMEAHLAYFRHDIVKCAQLHTQSLETYQSIHDRIGEGFELEHLGELYCESDSTFSRGVKNLNQAFQIATEFKNDRLLRLAKSGMAVAYGFIFDYENALINAKAALELSEKAGDKYLTSVSLGNIAICLGSLQKFDSAEYYADKGIIFATNQKQIRLLILCVTLKATVQVRKKKFNQGLQLAMRAIEMASQSNEKFYKIHSFLIAGTACIGLGKFEEAKNYLTQSLELNGGMSRGRIHIYNALFSLYKSKKEYATALDYFEKLKILNDSVLSVDKKRVLARLEGELSLNLKNQEIKTLEALNLANQMQSQATVQIYSFGIVGIIGMAIFAFYFRERYQKKMRHYELELKLRSQKESIRQDLHDSLGGQLSSISLGLNRLSNDHTDDTVNNIQGMADKALSELRNSLWVMSKDSVSMAELEQRINGLFWQYRKIETQIDLQISVDQALLNVQLPSNKAGHLFRIMQEAMHNSVKHSKASHFSIAVERVNEHMKVVMHDNGIGFEAIEHPDGEHYGIKNMKARAEQMDSRLELVASSNGTHLILHVSINS